MGSDYPVRMLRTSLFCLGALTLVLSSCSSPEESTRSETESESPREREGAPERTAPVATSPNSDGTPDPTRAWPEAPGREGMPLQVGQWVRYVMHVPGGGRGDVYYRVTHEEDDQIWIEFERRSGSRQNVMAIRVRKADIGGEQRPVPTAIRNYNSREGVVRDLPSRLIPHFGQMIEPFLGALFHEWPATEPELTEVPAGRFAGAVALERSEELVGAQVRVKEWFHPEVPITGMVRFQSMTNEEHRMELHSFGTEGAASAFPSSS